VKFDPEVNYDIFTHYVLNNFLNVLKQAMIIQSVT